MTDRDLDELRRLGEELRALFADERRAISALDHERLNLLAEQKRTIVAALTELRPRVGDNKAARALFEAIRVEAHATALLASTATQLVQKLLGRETNGYNRRGATTTSTPLRSFRAY